MLFAQVIDVLHQYVTNIQEKQVHISIRKDKCNDRKETVFDFTVGSLCFAGDSACSLGFVNLPGRQST